MKTLEQIEAEIREKVRREMQYFMRVEQYEPLEEDIWSELPPIKPILQDYDMYSDYLEYYGRNINE